MKKWMIFLFCILLSIPMAGCNPAVKNNSMDGLSQNATESNGNALSGGDWTKALSSSQDASQAVSTDTAGNSSASQTPQSTPTGTGGTSSKTASISMTVTYPEITQANLIPLTFDFLDYMRTQSLGKNFSTPAAERQRVATLISSYWSQIDATSKNTLTQMAQLGQRIKPVYEALSTTLKNQTKADWKKAVLSPTLLYAPLNNPKTYSSGGISFCCPSDWSWWSVPYSGGEYLFVMKDTAQTYSYNEIIDMTTAPAGNLSTIFSDSGSSSQIADTVSASVTSAAPNMVKINTIDTALGSVRVMAGKFPGQTEEKFMWLVVIPKNGQYIFCRMSGPVSQADTLVPAFYNMLNTLNWSTTPAGGGSSGGASGAFETAWSRVSTAIVADIWAK